MRILTATTVILTRHIVEPSVALAGEAVDQVLSFAGIRISAEAICAVAEARIGTPSV